LQVFQLAQGAARDITAAPPVAERRVALVIGNSRYAVGPLNNPGNDARAITGVLQSLGFEVLSHVDLDLVAMRRALADFGERMAEGGVALFYYSGHGLQVGGKNYLVPLRARLTSERYIAAETVEVDAVLKEMDAARNRLNVLVLDACRDNPFARGWRGAARGLAQISGPPGTFIAYATDPGDVAADGEPGTNGVYTGELLRALPEPGLKIEETFKRAARGVNERTRGRQRPWITSSFTGDFVFVPVGEGQRDKVTEGQKETTPPPPPSPQVTSLSRLGSLLIRSPKESVEVWLGDKRLGEATPGADLLVENVAAGQYPVRATARRQGFKPWTRNVQVAAGQQLPLEIDLDPLGPPPVIKGEDGAEMVLIPAGEFSMGSTREEVDRVIVECKGAGAPEPRCKEWHERELPRHRVEVDPFYLDKYEVTNAQFRRFIQAGNSAQGDWQQYATGKDQHPVVNVTWNDAVAYCRWAGKRLPTEAEWEKAARGTDGRRYPWGDSWDPARANGAMSVKTTTPVGNYPTGVSPYGVYDMAGNVWEWVQDWYGPYASGDVRNPTGVSTGQSRILRGGAWINLPIILRSAYRFTNPPENRYVNFGFRCASESPMPGRDAAPSRRTARSAGDPQARSRLAPGTRANQRGRGQGPAGRRPPTTGPCHNQEARDAETMGSRWRDLGGAGCAGDSCGCPAGSPERDSGSGAPDDHQHGAVAEAEAGDPGFHQAGWFGGQIRAVSGGAAHHEHVPHAEVRGDRAAAARQDSG